MRAYRTSPKAPPGVNPQSNQETEECFSQNAESGKNAVVQSLVRMAAILSFFRHSVFAWFAHFSPDRLSPSSYLFAKRLRALHGSNTADIFIVAIEVVGTSGGD